MRTLAFVLVALTVAAGAAELELKWDAGSAVGQLCYYTGAETYYGNDFNISTIATYRYVSRYRFYVWPNWPNGVYEGCRACAFAFTGGAPGSLLWGPTYAPNTGQGWNDWSIGWTLPAGTQAFVAAAEQYYNYPNCDPVSWSSTGTQGHGWYHYGGTWRPWSQAQPGNNPLMIRCVVDDSHSAIAPLSLGRVKALYR